MQYKFNMLLILVVLFMVTIPVNAKELYEAMKENAISDGVASEFVTSSDGIDFLETSSDTNGKGLYFISNTSSDQYPILYYRGSINNNYVIYAGYCWQIIRTTSTGGIKIMYAGLPSDNKCNNSGADLAIGKSQYNDQNSAPKYGWTYQSDGEEIDSLAKSYLDEWYKNNLTDHTRELEDTVWCNDRRNVNDVFDARTRLEAGNPDLSCDVADSYTVSSSKGNGKLTYPVAIINADEVTYAGEVLKKTQVDTFVNISYSYWSMTPYVLTKNMYPNSKGMLNMYTFTYSAGIRPMVSLKNTATFNKGDGTPDNPYRVEVEKQYFINTDEYSDVNVEESESGKVISVNVDNRDGYKFLNLKVVDKDGNDLGLTINNVNGTYQFSMPEEDVWIITNYRIIKDSFKLTSSQEEVEIPEEMVEQEQEGTFSVNPTHGYKIVSVELYDTSDNLLNIDLTQDNNTYKFIMPNHDVVVKATFEELPKYTITGEDVEVANEEYYEGDLVEFNVKSYPKKIIKKISFFTEDGEEVDISLNNNSNKYSFNMIDKNLIVKVEYKDKVYNNPKTFAFANNHNFSLFVIIILLSIIGIVKSYQKNYINSK